MNALAEAMSKMSDQVSGSSTEHIARARGRARHGPGLRGRRRPSRRRLLTEAGLFGAGAVAAA